VLKAILPESNFVRRIDRYFKAVEVPAGFCAIPLYTAQVRNKNDHSSVPGPAAAPGAIVLAGTARRSPGLCCPGTENSHNGRHMNPRGLHRHTTLALLLAAGIVTNAAHAAGDEATVTQGLYNWIHTTGNADLAFPFYRDIFGFALENSTFATANANTPPPRIRTREEAGSDALIWQLTNTEGSRSRTVFMGTPGIGFGLELSEFLDIARDERPANPWDPGASILVLEVRDFAEVVRRLDAANAPVVSRGGEPTRAGTSDAILVRDPDGYLVLVRAAANAAADTGMVTDIDIALSVASTEDSLAFYRDLMQFEIGATAELPDASLALFGLDAGRVLQTATRIPNTGVDVLLWEFDVPDGIPVQAFAWRIQDVGAPQFQLQVRDLDDLLLRTSAAGHDFLSVDGKPIQRPFGRFVFAKDPDSVLVEYVEPAAP
jgi:catechol 2,3-dioxygenase-like lactoylglutathione lyase family enzyme